MGDTAEHLDGWMAGKHVRARMAPAKYLIMAEVGRGRPMMGATDDSGGKYGSCLKNYVNAEVNCARKVGVEETVPRSRECSAGRLAPRAKAASWSSCLAGMLVGLAW